MEKKDVRYIQVLSPFFESEEYDEGIFSYFLSPVSVFPNLKFLDVFFQNKELQHNLPVKKLESFRSKIRLFDLDFDRPLHGKAFAIYTSSHAFISYGSANFTTAALYRNLKEMGNIETVITLKLPLIRGRNTFEKSILMLKERVQISLEDVEQPFESQPLSSLDGGQLINEAVLSTETQKLEIYMSDFFYNLPEPLLTIRIGSQIIQEFQSLGNMVVVNDAGRYLKDVDEKYHCATVEVQVVSQKGTFRDVVMIQFLNPEEFESDGTKVTNEFVTFQEYLRSLDSMILGKHSGKIREKSNDSSSSLTENEGYESE